MPRHSAVERRGRRQLARAAAYRRRLAAHSPGLSPLAPPGGFPDLPAVDGLTLAAAEAGVRYRGRPDVMLARLAPGTALAGVTTRSATRAACVLDVERKLAGAATAGPDAGAAILVNAGNANAFTGAEGGVAVERLSASLAAKAGLSPDRVLTASTGVIGEPLAWGRIDAVLDDLLARQDRLSFRAAARAIMTTDTYPKGAGAVVELGGEAVSIAGIAKGSGMIAPDMATMLAFVFTDARLGAGRAQRLLAALSAETFNAVTVDGDTSTSDLAILAATGRRGPDLATDPAAAAFFEAALAGVLRDLAMQIVRDGEGATKLVEIRVTGAESDADARAVARSIANSPLVKTAFAGEDPNWGRIVMAVGKAGVPADRDRLSIRFGDIIVAEGGRVAPGYAEAAGAAYMRRAELAVAVELGLGNGVATVWTCDLGNGYVAINADYRS